MKVILEIPDEEVEIIKRNGFNKDGTFSFKLNEVVKQAMRNGVILPDNATNGDMIKAMFPYACFEEYEDECRYIVIMRADGKASIVRSDFEWDWWNAPYKGGQEDGKA